MPQIRSLRHVQSSPQAAELLEMRTMLSASSRKGAPLADSPVQGTIDVQAISFNQNITGKMSVSGLLQSGKKLTLDITINPPGDPINNPISGTFKSKIVSIQENGSQRTITLQGAKKSIDVPVSFGGRTFNFSAKPKSGNLTLVIDVAAKTVQSFNIAYTIGPIPTVTDSPSDVTISLQNVPSTT